MLTQSTKEVSASDAKRHFGELLSMCVYGGQEILIKKHGKTVARLISEINKSAEDKHEKPEHPVFKALMQMHEDWKKRNPNRKLPKHLTAVALVRQGRDERDAYWEKRDKAKK